ncbi:EKC/KEOPS complex subunit TPRKB-like [Prorops nasuta]|uniref:EKC/KEOPS complex subunit TPRKB-like n=1 Tax=Prorops nasuta TaxID=863751 RepID=UPI0034CD9A25
MSEFCVKLDDETELYLTLRLYTSVENTNEIRKNILSGELPCCMLKAGLIFEPFQIVVAANKAALNKKNNQLTTKTVYTELLFCLSTSKNISQSLIEFGIDDKEEIIIAAIIHKEKEDKPILELINDNVKGKEVPIQRLSEYSDCKRIRKTYKIDEAELKVSNFIDSIVSRISIKDFASLKQ